MVRGNLNLLHVGMSVRDHKRCRSAGNYHWFSNSWNSPPENTHLDRGSSSSQTILGLVTVGHARTLLPPQAHTRTGYTLLLMSCQVPLFVLVFVVTIYGVCGRGWGGGRATRPTEHPKEVACGQIFTTCSSPNVNDDGDDEIECACHGPCFFLSRVCHERSVPSVNKNKPRKSRHCTIQ